MTRRENKSKPDEAWEGFEFARTLYAPSATPRVYAFAVHGSRHPGSSAMALLLPRLTNCAGQRLSRQLFTLPDLSSLSPFSGGDGGDPPPQVYHERKIFPCVTRSRVACRAPADHVPH